ncbi:MAG: DUF2240 family protein [archaeon]
MIKMPFEDILKKITEKTGKTDGELQGMVKAKMDQLSGLISKEGAAHIIANELGVKLFDFPEKVKISELLEGMRDITIDGRVVQVYEVREFDTGTRKGKVGAFLLGDESGVVRIVLWNDQADKLATLEQNGVIRIKNAFVKKNNDRLEMHLNERSEIEKAPADAKVGEVAAPAPQEKLQKKINDLTEADRNVSILGTVVQVFDPRFFEICPECGKRARPKEGQFACEAHGNVTPDYGYVLNLFADDGSDNIRVVCFRQTAQQLTGKTDEEFKVFRTDPSGYATVKTDLLGHIMRFSGRVTKNQMFDRLEFIADNVEPDVDPKEEVDRLNKEIKKVEDEIGGAESEHPKQEPV